MPRLLPGKNKIPNQV